MKIPPHLPAKDGRVSSRRSGGVSFMAYCSWRFVRRVSPAPFLRLGKVSFFRTRILLSSLFPNNEFPV